MSKPSALAVANRLAPSMNDATLSGDDISSPALRGQAHEPEQLEWEDACWRIFHRPVNSIMPQVPNDVANNFGAAIRPKAGINRFALCYEQVGSFLVVVAMHGRF